MYCNNCGKELPAEGKICASCGTSFETQQKPLVKKGWFVLVLGIIAAIVTVFFVSKALSPNASPENVVETMVKARFELDAEAFAQCYADYWLEDWTYSLGIPKDSSRKEIIKRIKKKWALYTEEKVKITSCEEIARYDKGEYRIYYKEEGMSESDYENITEIAKVEAVFVVDGDRQTRTFTCIKMSGKWYVMDGF